MKCGVEGCARRGSVEVWMAEMAGPTPAVTDVVADDDLAPPLLACPTHAEQLGVIRDESDHERPYVVVSPARAAGWRLVIVIRPTGRHAVVFFPPEVT